jgi:hypothetical protein
MLLELLTWNYTWITRVIVTCCWLYLEEAGRNIQTKWAPVWKGMARWNRDPNKFILSELMHLLGGVLILSQGISDLFIYFLQFLRTSLCNYHNHRICDCFHTVSLTTICIGEILGQQLMWSHFCIGKLYFVWYMASLVVKNEQQKGTCFNEIGLCAQNIDIILGSTMHEQFWEGPCDHLKRRRIFSLTSWLQFWDMTVWVIRNS